MQRFSDYCAVAARLALAAATITLSAASIAEARVQSTLFAPTFPGLTNVAPARSHSRVRHDFKGLGLTPLYEFYAAPDGRYPIGSLIRSNGAFYGITAQGGTGTCTGNGVVGCGTVFKLSPSGSGFIETMRYSFQGGSDGEFPEGSLIMDATGALYGTTVVGGSGACSTLYGNGCGTVFKLTPGGSGYTESILYSFKAGADGALPGAGLMMDKHGNLFGTTVFGGTGSCMGTFGSGCGTVFELTPQGSGYAESVIHEFQAGIDGAFPSGILIEDTHGALYGTTEQGGGNVTCSNGCGTVFKLSPYGNGGYTETVMHAFQGPPNDGASPSSTLVAYKGALYGTTADGGYYGDGTVFELTTTETMLYQFAGPEGGQPGGPILMDKTGSIYGMTSFGGSTNCTSGCGSAFKLTATPYGYVEGTLWSFLGGDDGGNPQGAGFVGSGKMLYGSALFGGTYGYGDVFQLQTGTTQSQTYKQPLRSRI